MIELLGGQEGAGFKKFKKRMVEGFMALSNESEKILILLHMMGQSNRDLPCFKAGYDQTIIDLRNRLCPFGAKTKMTKK